MICQSCQENTHFGCPGKGHCDCQHRGKCGAGEQPCGKAARLYACGWRCDAHKP